MIGVLSKTSVLGLALTAKKRWWSPEFFCSKVCGQFLVGAEFDVGSTSELLIPHKRMISGPVFGANFGWNMDNDLNKYWSRAIPQNENNFSWQQLQWTGKIARDARSDNSCKVRKFPGFLRNYLKVAKRLKNFLFDSSSRLNNCYFAECHISWTHDN